MQITHAEDIGVAGRAGYYDGIGAARDIIQNHLLQLMALTAMEEPVSFSAADLTAEKTKVLSAVRLPKDRSTPNNIADATGAIVKTGLAVRGTDAQNNADKTAKAVSEWIAKAGL